MRAAGGRSDAGGDPEAARVLLLGAGRQGVVEGAEFRVHRRVEVVEDLLPAGRLVVGAGQEQLPGLRLAVALAPLGQELREVGVLGGRLLRRRGTRRQSGGVSALEHLDDRLDHFGSHLARFAHLLPPPSSSPASGTSPATGNPTTAVQDAARWPLRRPRAVWRQIASGPTGTIAVHWRIRLVAYGARLESGLGATPRALESTMLRSRHDGFPPIRR